MREVRYEENEVLPIQTQVSRHTILLGED